MFKTALFLLFLFLLQLTSAQVKNPVEQLADEYFNEGEYEKALMIYQKIYKEKEELPIAFKIGNCYALIGNWSEAHAFIDKVGKKNSKEVLIPAYKGLLFQKEKKTNEAQQTWEDLIRKIKTQEDFLKVGAFLFMNKQFEWAEKCYLQGRNSLKNNLLFADELSQTYVALGKYGKATSELILLLVEKNANFDLIKGKIAVMNHENSKDEMESALLQSITKYKDNTLILEILYDFYVQSENFEEAFAQIKQLDRIYQDGGSRLMQFSKLLQLNQQYEFSNKVNDYILQKHNNSSFVLLAMQEKAINFEKIAFDIRPVDTNKLRKAVIGYDDFLSKHGRQTQFFDAMYHKASLCVFYLNDLDAAYQEMQIAENMATLHPNLLSKAKLLLGDILLLRGEIQKAELKYNEVEKENKDTQIGALAKFKQAMLFYYRGDFEMAKAFFKILKDNTSNDIANDAIDKFLLIQDNTGLDSTTEALGMFAKAQLFIYQKNYEKAIPILDSLQLKFSNHALKDDIVWEKSQIAYQQQDIEKCLFFLDQILTNYQSGIYGDDALFMKAEIVDYIQKNLEKAQELYLQFLMEYPGSVHKVAVRKRIRQLRGDKNQ